MKLKVIRKVLSGELYVSEKLMSQILGSLEEIPRGDAPDSHSFLLSKREFQVLSLLGEGYTPRMIAEKLNLNIKTVWTYCGHIREKLSIESQPELVQYALARFSPRKGPEPQTQPPSLSFHPETVQRRRPRSESAVKDGNALMREPGENKPSWAASGF